MKKGDCFIMKGSVKEDPIYIYLIEEINDKQLYAFRIIINDKWIMAWDFPNSYKNDLSSATVTVPNDVYYKVKELIKQFAIAANEYTWENLLEGDVVIEPGKLFSYRFINTFTKIDGSRAYFDIFRTDFEVISPCCRGEADIEVLKDRLRPLPEYVYDEIMSRYKKFLQELREYVFNLPGKKYNVSGKNKGTDYEDDCCCTTYYPKI